MKFFKLKYNFNSIYLILICKVQNELHIHICTPLESRSTLNNI